MRTRNIVPFVDVLFTFLMVFVCITMLLKAKMDNDSSSYQQQNAVYLIVLNWEGNADLDLWSKDPQNRIVSFHRREGGDGSLFSLNRDCLGAMTTEVGPDGVPVNKINEEIITIRGVIAGEYVVNVHAYSMKNSPAVKAKVKLVKNKPYKVVVEKEKEFSHNGDEETYFRFSLNKDGDVTEINELPVSLTQDRTQDQQQVGPQEQP
jgi:hypothetical protein